MNIVKRYYPLLILLLSFTTFLLVNSCSDSISPDERFVIDQQSCISCGDCEKVCPSNAIISSGDKYEIIQTKCTECGNCAAICPEDAIN